MTVASARQRLRGIPRLGIEDRAHEGAETRQAACDPKDAVARARRPRCDGSSKTTLPTRNSTQAPEVPDRVLTTG